jgi:deoxycytidylate deaminase
MEIVDELKGMLKATGAQIKSRLKVGEATEAPVVEALEEKVAEADKTSVSEIVQNTSSTECVANPTNQVIDRVFQLRENFVIIGLTGRTGSGCTTVAGKLTTAEWKELKTNYKDFNSDQIDNVVRKNRIVHRYLKEHWTQAFDVISASDIIFYYALKESFDDFANSLASVNIEPDEESKYEKSKPIIDTALREELNKLQDEFNALHDKVMECEEYLHEPDYNNTEKLELVRSVVFTDIKTFRKSLEGILTKTIKKVIASELQSWGNNIRKYNSIKPQAAPHKKAPSCLARKINQIIKVFRAYDKNHGRKTLIAIDALRNPFEVLYFRERYAAFYLMAVHTEEKIRRDALFKRGFRIDEIEHLDKVEGEKPNFHDSYEKIDIDKCIELADIHLAHDGTDKDYNRDMVNQIFTYVALIFHPGLIPPSPLERCMQVAYTAKLNSGCLSRQVGAAVTNEYFSVQSIGWNTVAEGQTPCSLRNLYDLFKDEDEGAFSDFERFNDEFSIQKKKLIQAYEPVKAKLNGLNLSYCFKDVYTSSKEKQRNNQVHTRSLHAEENAFLQLAKYGTQGIKGGKLFTTASCCELCSKKAYQLGITEIYYIDTYPGISRAHILESGVNRPQMLLFKGAIGRAYVNLFTPFLPLKDEIEELTDVKVKKVIELKAQQSQGGN